MMTRDDSTGEPAADGSEPTRDDPTWADETVSVENKAQGSGGQSTEASRVSPAAPRSQSPDSASSASGASKARMRIWRVGGMDLDPRRVTIAAGALVVLIVVIALTAGGGGKDDEGGGGGDGNAANVGGEVDGGKGNGAKGNGGGGDRVDDTMRASTQARQAAVAARTAAERVRGEASDAGAYRSDFNEPDAVLQKGAAEFDGRNYDRAKFYFEQAQTGYAQAKTAAKARSDEANRRINNILKNPPKF